MLLPLYVFTLVFIVGPLVYMVILSFSAARPKPGA